MVIADTGPINYSIPIGHIDLLPSLFQHVIIPNAVREELRHFDAPAVVREWIANLPAWLEIMETTGFETSALDEGEAAVIALALSLRRRLGFDRRAEGREDCAQAHWGKPGLRVTGTLGLLELAAESGLVDFKEAAERLRQTTFRSPEALLETMLRKHRRVLP